MTPPLKEQLSLVRVVCGVDEHVLSDAAIEQDLQHTGSAETTINRILDGTLASERMAAALRAGNVHRNVGDTDSDTSTIDLADEQDPPEDNGYVPRALARRSAVATGAAVTVRESTIIDLLSDDDDDGDFGNSNDDDFGSYSNDDDDDVENAPVTMTHVNAVPSRDKGKAAAVSASQSRLVYSGADLDDASGDEDGIPHITFTAVSASTSTTFTAMSRKADSSTAEASIGATNVGTTKTATAVPSRKRVLNPDEQQQRLLDKELEKQAKLQQREQAKVERQLAKAQRDLEKAREVEERKAMRTANKLVTDKRLVATEMIVELDTRMVEECGGEALVVALQAIGAKTHVRNLAHPRTVTWKRVVSKTYSTEMNAFVPTARAYLHDEPFVLWCLTANTLAEMIARNDVAPEVRRLKYAFPGKQVLVVVDGLDDYFRKIRLETKRSFAKQVRDVGSASSQPAPSAIGAAVTLPRHTPDAIDQALLQLNCTLDCNVMTTSRGETVTDWLVTYTREVAIRPYEKLKMRATPKFAVDDLGPSGKTLGDTWSRMLHMLWGVTPPIAEAVLAAYPTIDSLLRAYDEVGPERASRLLENVMVNRQGYAASGLSRRLGASLSHRIYLNLTATDASMTFR